MKHPTLSPAAIAAGLTVEKFVIGHAYARNGNAHNPTERVVWQVKQGARCTHGTPRRGARSRSPTRLRRRASEEHDHAR